MNDTISLDALADGSAMVTPKWSPLARLAVVVTGMTISWAVVVGLAYLLTDIL